MEGQIPLVSPILKLVMDKLGSGIWKELELFQSVKKDIEKLQSTLSTIKDALEDAEQRSISNKPLCNWLKKLKDAAYDADDVMDVIQKEALRRRMENHGHPLKGQARDFFSSHNHIAFRHRIASKIKDLPQRFDAIAEERIKLQLALLNNMNDSSDRKGGGGGGGDGDGGSAGGSGGSGGSGGRGEGGDSGSNGNQPGGYNNNGSLFFNLEEYNNWRLNARRVKILLLSSLLLEFLRKRSISPMGNYLRGCGFETHQNTDLKIQMRGVSVNEL